MSLLSPGKHRSGASQKKAYDDGNPSNILHSHDYTDNDSQATLKSQGSHALRPSLSFTTGICILILLNGNNPRATGRSRTCCRTMNLSSHMKTAAWHAASACCSPC